VGATEDVRQRNPRGEGDRLRAALMEAAAELLLEHGSVRGLSVRSITARAGVSPTAMYLHFANKEELVRAVSLACFQELWDFLREAAEAHGDDPRAELRAIGAAYLEFAQSRPGHYRILFATAGRVAAAGPPGPAEEDPGTAALELLVGATARCLHDGRDPEAVAQQLWIGVHGFVTLRLALPHLDWPDAEDFITDLHAAHLGPG
jgi:AcrR family transcriptional regulator